MSIKVENTEEMFLNRAVNKSFLLVCGLGAGDQAGSHFHTGQPDLVSTPTENSKQLRLSYGGNECRSFCHGVT